MGKTTNCFFRCPVLCFPQTGERKGRTLTAHYEIISEAVNPCGGEEYAVREIFEADAESPEAYVAAHGRYPITDTFTDETGDRVIVTSNGRGYAVRYTFSE